MTTNRILDIAMTSAIMSDVIMKKLYKKQNQGYMQAANTIADWAIEFEAKHVKTDWEDVLDNTMQPLSKELKSIICWDDAVMDFAHYKLSLLD